MFDDDIEELAGMVQRARQAVVFTGAGMSTECGIPDFRSPGGFWTKYKPIDFKAFLSSEETRLEAWRRFLMIRETIGEARPGRGHLAVAELLRRGHVSHVITQNIDGLHQRSGLDPDKVGEVNGTIHFSVCWSCGDRRPMQETLQRVRAGDPDPSCDLCSGILKSDTISFGQSLVEEVIDRAMRDAETCDLLIAVGSTFSLFRA